MTLVPLSVALSPVARYSRSHLPSSDFIAAVSTPRLSAAGCQTARCGLPPAGPAGGAGAAAPWRRRSQHWAVAAAPGRPAQRARVLQAARVPPAVPSQAWVPRPPCSGGREDAHGRGRIEAMHAAACPALPGCWRSALHGGSDPPQQAPTQTGLASRRAQTRAGMRGCTRRACLHRRVVCDGARWHERVLLGRWRPRCHGVHTPRACLARPATPAATATTHPTPAPQTRMPPPPCPPPSRRTRVVAR